MSKKEYIIGSGDIESFIAYYTAGSMNTKFYVSHISDNGHWYFTDDEYEAEIYDKVEVESVADDAREDFGIELTIEEIDDKDGV